MKGNSKRIKYCDYCSNSYVNGVPPEYDYSFITVGTVSEEGNYSLFIEACGASKSPVSIKFTKWDENAYYLGHKGSNVEIGKYVPKYCPECGRRIKENDEYRKTIK